MVRQPRPRRGIRHPPASRGCCHGLRRSVSERVPHHQTRTIALCYRHSRTPSSVPLPLGGVHLCPPPDRFRNANILFPFFRGHVPPIPFASAGDRLERELIVQTFSNYGAAITVGFGFRPVNPPHITGRYLGEEHVRLMYLVAGPTGFPCVVVDVHSVSGRFSVIRMRCCPIHWATGEATPLPHIL